MCQLFFVTLLKRTWPWKWMYTYSLLVFTTTRQSKKQLTYGLLWFGQILFECTFHFYNFLTCILVILRITVSVHINVMILLLRVYFFLFLIIFFIVILTVYLFFVIILKLIIQVICFIDANIFSFILPTLIIININVRRVHLFLAIHCIECNY